MKTLKVEWDTRPLQRPDPLCPSIPTAGYTGDQVAQRMDAARRQAIAEGYDEFEFRWWDYCEGWVTARWSITRKKACRALAKP